MLKKAEKIARKLAEFNNISYTHFPNSSRFRITSATGVKWSTRATKLGNVHYYDNHLYLAFDFPNKEITESYVREVLKMPLKNPREKKSGFYLKDDNDSMFGTVRISLYQDILSELDLNNSPLIDFAVKVFNKSMN